MGFLVDGRSNLREMCDRVFVLIGAIGFLGFWAIEFERNVRSGFWVDWAIGFLG